MRERVVLITGGSRGIGAAAVRAFAGAGYRVAFSYCQSKAQAQALQGEFPGQVLAFPANVASPAQVREMFRGAKAALGPVEVLVCCAGIAQQKLFTSLTDEDWQHMLDVNLSGAFYCCRAALPDMIRARWGRVLLVSSMWGQTGASCEVHYSAAKAGLIGLGKALAKEEGPSGVTVNILAPGVVDTDMMAGFTAQDRQALAEETPVGRLAAPSEIARTLLFLAGEESGYITGQVIGQNGGLVV